MLASTVLDVVFGMIFVYYALALVCCGAVEMIANWAKKRSKFLLRGVRDLIEGTTPNTKSFVGTPRRWFADWTAEQSTYKAALAATPIVAPAAGVAPAAAAAVVAAVPQVAPAAVAAVPQVAPGAVAAVPQVAPGAVAAMPQVAPPAVAAVPAVPAVGEDPTLRVADILGHALAQPYRQSTASGTATRNPSYLPAPVFGAVLTDLLTPLDDVTMAGLKGKLDALPAENAQLKKALQSMVKIVGTDLDALRQAIEKWFDSQMDRVTGSYKRWAKRWVIAVAVVVVGAGGVDSIAIAKSLYTDDAVRTAVVQAAEQASTLCPANTPDAACAANARAKVESVGLPLGWPTSTRPHDGFGWFLKIVGMLLSVGAAALGAPFWYKLLDRVGTLRNTGQPPS